MSFVLLSLRSLLLNGERLAVAIVVAVVAVAAVVAVVYLSLQWIKFRTWHDLSFTPTCL